MSILRPIQFISSLLSAICLLALGWFGHSFFGGKAAPAGRAPAAVPSVAVGEIVSETFNPPEEFVGHVEPVQEVDILPQIEGYVKEVKFTEGDEVKEGDLLFVIDAERYSAADGVAKAEIAQARSKVAQSEAAVDRAERYLKRLKSADARGITQTELDSAETGLAADRAALASAKAAVTQAEANLALAAFNLKHTKIYAPISGRIGKSFRHAGDYVSPSKDALARIVQMDPVRVSFPITDRAALAWRRNAAQRNARVGDTRRLRLRLADDSVYPFTGSWEFFDNEMSAETATLLVRALFPNKSLTLVPNAYVTVLADEADPSPVPVVPTTSIAVSGQKTGLWFLSPSNTVHFHEVQIAARSGGKAALAPTHQPPTPDSQSPILNSKIVIQGIHKLGEGMRVKVVPASKFQ